VRRHGGRRRSARGSRQPLSVDADSALALVESLSRDSLPGEGDRAYRDLLVTQARYKCYITATSDSDINRALDYYRAHSGEREKLTRAYIYKGAVMEELGHPDSAMLYYKHAEATAAPDDYFNLGYVNLRIGELYQSYYQNDSAVLSRMGNAAHFFTLANDTNLLITSLGTYGAYKNNEDTDTAIKYLEKAISLAKQAHSAKRFSLQSKLAGIYFYKKDYDKAKSIAMDIVENGRNYVNEYQYYYYAARSFIELSCLDSARMVQSMIPDPMNEVDSMNHYRLIAQLAKAENNYSDYATFISKYKDVSDRILTPSQRSDIGQVEVQWDMEDDFTLREKKNHRLFIIILVAVVLSILLIVNLLAKRLFARMKIAHTSKIESLQHELEKTIKTYECELAKQRSSIEHQRTLLLSKEKEFNEVVTENHSLHCQQKTLQDQVSTVVRLRLAAIRELHYDIRVKSTSTGESKKKTSLPLMGLIKDLNEERRLTYIKPSNSFWEKLKMSIEGEYPGINDFIEQKCPHLSLKERQLFWLLCAKIPPQLIRLCVNYSSVVTVSNNKRKLIKDVIGLDVSFEEFLQMYLEGVLN
jgi:hypothetical protein